MILAQNQLLSINRLSSKLAITSLTALPNPVFIKDVDLKYLWINKAFEDLFQVSTKDVHGKLDIELFKDKTIIMSSLDDINVFASDDIFESYQTIFEDTLEARDILVRKHSLELDEGQRFLIGVISDITEIVLAKQALEIDKALLEVKFAELRHMANTDMLTDCLNRRALFDIASLQLPIAKTSCVLVLDLDFFKRVNDSYGHEAGDTALKHFADVVKTKIRTTDLFARIGGEEFAILMLETKLEEASVIAERIRAAVEITPMDYKGQAINITVSIGGALSSLTTQKVNLDYLLTHADKALYQAKEQGRNKVIISA